MESSQFPSTDVPLLLNDALTTTHDLSPRALSQPSHSSLSRTRTVSTSTVSNSISQRLSTFINTPTGKPEASDPSSNPPSPYNPQASLPSANQPLTNQESQPAMYSVQSVHYSQSSYPTAVSHSQLPVWPASNTSQYYNDHKKSMDYAQQDGYFDYRSQHYYQDSMGRIVQPTPVVHSTGSPTQPPFLHRAHQTPSPIGSESSINSRSVSPPASRPSSNRSNSTDSTTSSGSSRSVRWNDEQLIQPDPLPHVPRPHGFWNRRGDRLWTNDGRWKPAPPGCEYPPHLKDYPEPGQGWQNEHGVRISMSHRRIPELCKSMPKSALKKTSQMGMGF